MLRATDGLTLLLTSLFILASGAGRAWAAGPEGVWLRDDGNARVQFAPCGDKLCATNLWIKDTSSGEEIGDQLVMTLQPTSSGTLAGTAFDRKRGRTYTLTISLGVRQMSTRGCILGGLFCKEVNWTLAPPGAH
jgi:uncharacterized protein (DUF2147 family)